MPVIVHIWKGKIPQYSFFNAVYGVNVGHASMTIIDFKNNKKQIYISHRPKVINTNNTVKDDSKKYLLKGYYAKAEKISFHEECQKRGRMPDIEICLYSPDLDTSRMINYSKKYLCNNLPESESLYHIWKNNCCSVVVNFIRQGLMCPKLEKTCLICDKSQHQKGYHLNLERILVRDYLKEWNVWSPVTLEVFVNNIRRKIESKNLKNEKFSCPKKPIQWRFILNLIGLIVIILTILKCDN